MPWAPWDHSTTCTTSWRSERTHTHTFHSNPFKTFLFPIPFSASVPQLSSPHDHQKKQNKNGHPGCCVTPGEAANWLVYCLPSHWGLEPRPKWMQPLLNSVRLNHSSDWHSIGPSNNHARRWANIYTKRYTHIDTHYKWNHSRKDPVAFLLGEKKEEKHKIHCSCRQDLLVFLLSISYNAITQLFCWLWCSGPIILLICFHFI